MSGEIDRMIVEADHDYDREINERLTTDLTPSPLDAALAQLCRRFRAAGASGKEEIRRKGAGRAGAAALVARPLQSRAAFLGERERSLEPIGDGLAAHAIENASLDFRDNLIARHSCTIARAVPGETRTPCFARRTRSRTGRWRTCC